MERQSIEDQHTGKITKAEGNKSIFCSGLNKVYNDEKECNECSHIDNLKVNKNLSERGYSTADVDIDGLVCNDSFGKFTTSHNEVQSTKIQLHEGITGKQFCCPLCNCSTTSYETIQKHINNDHADVLSPTRVDSEIPRVYTNDKNITSTVGNAASSLSEMEELNTSRPGKLHVGEQMHDMRHNAILNSEPLKRDKLLHNAVLDGCPICGLNIENTFELNIHIDQHFKNTPVKPTTLNTSKEQLPSSLDLHCPVCDVEFSDVTKLNRHINGHFSIPQTPVSPFSVDHSLVCPVCTMEFDDAQYLQAHVNGHFSMPQTPLEEECDSIVAKELEKEIRQKEEEREFGKLQTEYGMDGKTTFKKKTKADMEKAIYKGEINVTEYHNRMADENESMTYGVDSGHSSTPGVLEKIKLYYTSAAFNVSRVWLCSSVDHYAGSYGDKGWGCGYRNFQMLLSALVKNSSYKTVLFNGRSQIPSVLKIQQLIEMAWQKGFDTQGCEQLGGTVVNTTKWIGATEIVAVLSSLKVKCQLLDFHHPTGPSGSHPRLFAWVKDYFHKPLNFKAPLYLQHQGHSRTIVGIEELKDGSLRLLLFDPSTTREHMRQFHVDITSNLMRTTRRPVNIMKAKQYQIVAVIGILTDPEWQDSKTIKSDRVP